MEENEVKKKKNYSLIIAIVVVVAIIGVTYLGVYLYANYLVKYYEKETYKIVPLAREYVENNLDQVDKDIFYKLDMNKKVTDGIVYVNKDLEVALAIIYDDTVCYIKYYDSDNLIDNIKPDYCKLFLKLNIEISKEDDIKSTYDLGEKVVLTMGDDTDSEWRVIKDNGDTIRLMKDVALEKASYDDSESCKNYMNKCTYGTDGDPDSLPSECNNGTFACSDEYSNSSAKRIIDAYTNELGLGENLIDIGLGLMKIW